MHWIARGSAICLALIGAHDFAAAMEIDIPGASAVIPPVAGDLNHVGEAAVYRGDQLFDYIDGAAPLYIEYGFQEIASQEILLRGRTYIFDAYRLCDPLNAWGLWSVRRPAKPDPIGDLPRSSYVAYQGMAAVGPYLLEISAYVSGDTTEAEMAELIRLASAGIPDSLRSIEPTQAPPITHMPETGRAENSLRIARGPVSLRSAFGSLASDPFFDLIQVLRREIAEPVFARNRAEPPTWIFANYRLPGESETSAPATTLVLLVAPVPADVESRDALYGRVFEVGRKAVPSGESLALDGSWLSIDSERSMGAVRRGEDLALAVSLADPALFRTWLLDVAAGR